MRKFIKINEHIINIDQIKHIYKTKALDGKMLTKIDYGNGVLYCDVSYFNKLEDYIGVASFSEDMESVDVNDFPGDNMIEE